MNIAFDNSDDKRNLVEIAMPVFVSNVVKMTK
jgi:hypothetical protein